LKLKKIGNYLIDLEKKEAVNIKTKYYGDTPLVSAELPKNNTTEAEVESGLNICLYKLKESKLPYNKKLFGNVTVNDLRKVLKTSVDAISFTKSELGEAWFK
jgi:hypothetical protein